MRGNKRGRAIGPCIGSLAALVLLLGVFLTPPEASAQAKIPGTSSGTESTAPTPEIPADLSPEAVDALVARLTDAEIRAVLLAELRRRADERAAESATRADTLESVQARLGAMAMTIKRRVSRWTGALANIGDRGPRVAERLGLAVSGFPGMVLAALGVLIFGLAAALAVIWACGFWRGWLMAPQRGTYWDRVVRSIALGLVELAPIIAFVAATRIVAPLVAGSLGPLVDYVWIYWVGVAYSWAFIVISRRAFAPDAPAIRIAHLGDEGAGAIHRLVRRAVMVGAGGWLLAGLSPTLGLGFPPAMVTMATAGTAVAVLLLSAAIRNSGQIRAALQSVMIEGDQTPSAFSRIAVAACPVLLIVYIAGAWVYWLAHWLETGTQRLDGPAGTLVLLLLVPILDRLGSELCRSMIPRTSPAALRYRGALHGAWRTLLVIAAIFVIADLWGLDLYGLAKGEAAPRWADTAFDVAVTLLIAHVVWRLIRAALYTEEHGGSGGAEDGPAATAATRLDTLVPLFRNMLLTVLSVVVVMILLSAAGVDIGPLLASAGIVGIAVGFGAQTLVRDIFSGAFFLIDDAFRVGEYIELDQDLRGEVESISLRSLQLRHHRGPIVTIPFGELKSVTNHNRDWVIYKMSFRMEPDVDPKKVKKLVKAVGAEFLEHPDHGPKFIEPLKSQGVYMIDDDSAQVFRVKFKCRPRAQFVLRREIYHRLREVFAENGIGFARRKVEVVSSGGESHEELAAALPEEVAGPKPA